MIRNSPHRGETPRTGGVHSRHGTVAALVASLVLAVATGLALSAANAAPASAETPCSTKVINDWFDDDKIDGTYPKHCYTDAIDNLPPDIHTYMSAADDIRAALLATFQHKHNGTPPPSPNSPGSGPSEELMPSTSDPSATAAPRKSEKPKPGLILKAIEWLGPSDASALPLPLLILAAVAFLLLAAAGASLINRRLQKRRLPPPPQA
jgi:hypothetical protein